MKKRLPPWEKWELDAKKSKNRVIKKICSNCKQTFEINGLSAYEGLCKKCVEGI